ncbi:hypothetical protein NDU88_000717 [Pleurodeles waltl]|uniref:L27-1 domain-containing protein n=1 Tax=Pleurodeles waltl TaxID=8319 RepID=A0AAV7V9Q7_PLEWA|nr:hypothetical protein NDU88_000717 [Pleurodeles waltl]
MGREVPHNLQTVTLFTFHGLPLADAHRAVALLSKYQANMMSLSEEQLKASIGEVLQILASDLFHALLGTRSQHPLLYGAACFAATLELSSMFEHKREAPMDYLTFDDFVALKCGKFPVMPRMGSDHQTIMVWPE